MYTDLQNSFTDRFPRKLCITIYCRTFHLKLTVLLHYLVKITIAADFNGVFSIADMTPP